MGMELSRRGFLKALGITGAVLLVSPQKIVEAISYPYFDPREQYGNILEVRDIFDVELKKAVAEFFDAKIRQTIPPKYRNLIKYEFIDPIPCSYDPLGQIGYASWKYKLRRV